MIMVDGVQRRPVAWLLIAVLVVLAAASRLVPTEYRPFNFAAIGAVAMFAAARLGLGMGVVVAFAAMLLSDLALWVSHDYHSHYAPFPSVYLSIALYAVIAWALLRSSENPFRVASTALLGSTVFFLVTNAFSWLSPLHNYERNLAGLFDCYTMALPFYRTTLASDLILTVAAFALHTAICRIWNPAERLSLVPVTVEDRS
jgi:hypothetical protein